MNNHLSQRIILVVVVLAVAVVLGAWWWKESNLSRQNNLSAVGQSLPDSTATEQASLTVDDQFPGPLVFISHVQLPQGGWVVIHRDESGAPGAIAGVGYFDKDLTTGEVNLSRVSADGETYHAVLYRDDGNVIFDQKLDSVYRDDKGLPIVTTFRITKNVPSIKG